MAALLRLAALLAYFVVAHRALRIDSPRLAALALGLLAIVVCIRGLLSLRSRAWLLALAWIAAAAALTGSRYAVPLLLLMPSVFLALACSLFARTLAHGRVPLVVRMVALIEASPAGQLPADIRAYATNVTRLWAGLLAGLALLNLGLALVTTPGGVLERIGIAPPWPMSPEVAATVDTWGIYVPVAATMVGEFVFRQRRFPGRYSGPMDYLRKLAKIPREKWAGIFR
ncbi:MAG: hypothetical protein JF567_04330 [Xanthomonadales bacterium]|nr:hypothetical protein [Xanthomonadales bacterium]